MDQLFKKDDGVVDAVMEAKVSQQHIEAKSADAPGYTV